MPVFEAFDQLHITRVQNMLILGWKMCAPACGLWPRGMARWIAAFLTVAAISLFELHSGAQNR